MPIHEEYGAFNEKNNKNTEMKINDLYLETTLKKYIFFVLFRFNTTFSHISMVFECGRELSALLECCLTEISCPRHMI